MGLWLSSLLLTGATAATAVDPCPISPVLALEALAAQREADRREVPGTGPDVPVASPLELVDPLDQVGDDRCDPTLDTYEQALRDRIPYEHRGLDAAALGAAHADEWRLFRLGAKRIDSALAAGAIVEARLRIARMIEDERRLADPTQRADPPRGGKVLARLAELDRVAGGSEPRSLPEFRVPPDWSVGRSGDTSTDPEDDLVGLLPDTADALLASGRSEEALRTAVDLQWTGLVVGGSGSWRLVELGERVMGTVAYREAVEQAVRAIRIEQRPDGRYAAIPLFGRWRPLPLATPLQSYGPGTPLLDQLQEQARMMLSPQRPALDRVIFCIVVE